MFDLDSFLDETFADNSDIDDAAGLAAEDFMNGCRKSLPAYLVDQANKTARTAPSRIRSNAR